MKLSIIFFTAIILASITVVRPIQAAEEGCFCARYDYNKKAYEEEKKMSGISKSSECNGSLVKVEKPLNKSCLENAQYKNCKFKVNAGSGEIFECVCTDVQTNKQVDRSPKCFDDERFKSCSIILYPDGNGIDKCICQEARTKCRWTGSQGEAAGVSADVSDLQARAKSLDQFKRFKSVSDLVGQVIKILLVFVGSILLVLYVYAGLLWMTAGGNTERIDNSKQILVWATLGVAVMLSSYLIITYVFNLILKK